jgi:hypothetical protein
MQAELLQFAYLAYQQRGQRDYQVEQAEDNKNHCRADAVGQNATHNLTERNHDERAERVQADDALQLIAGDR